MDMNEAVAKAIGAERSIAGLTVRELATLTGIPERSLMRILQAERDIKVNQVEQIAGALRLYPHEIIERAEVILERAARLAPVIDGRFGQDEETYELREAAHEEIDDDGAENHD